MIGKSKKIGRTLIFATIVFGFIGFTAAKSFAVPPTDGEIDAKIEAFVEDFNAVSKEMTTAIAGDSTTAGIDSAQKAFDAKKDSLKEQFNGFKGARGFQVSNAVLKKFTASIINNLQAITDAFTKNAADYTDSQAEEASARFRKLLKDYADIFKMS